MPEAKRVFFRLPVEKIRNPFLRGLARVLRLPVEALVGFPTLNRIYRGVLALPAETPFERRVLEVMRITPGVAEEELAKIPKEGPVVVVANHPFGGIEGVLLLERLKTVRPDVKAMANYMRAAIPEMREDFIFVDPFAGTGSVRANLRPMKECIRWLGDGHLLIIFPAGEVAHFTWKDRRVVDPKWQVNVASIIQKSKASVTPIFFRGRNNLLFQIAGLIHPRLRTVLLPRNFANKQGKTLRFTVGSTLPPKMLEAFANDRSRLLHFLRFRVDLLAERNGGHAAGPREWVRRLAKSLPIAPISLNRMEGSTRQETIVPPVPAEELEAEIAALPPDAFLLKSGENAVYCASAAQIPRCLRGKGAASARVIGLHQQVHTARPHMQRPLFRADDLIGLQCFTGKRLLHRLLRAAFHIRKVVLPDNSAITDQKCRSAQAVHHIAAAIKFVLFLHTHCASSFGPR